MIDSDGYRPNVGIILCNDDGKLFWGRRVGQDTWQFPQGGIQANESPRDAMYRELAEEVGLACADVEVIANTQGWLRYRLPERFIRRHSKPICIGQKQIWFILRLLADESNVRFDLTDHPEFDGWRWVDYWRPSREVVHFKRGVYIRVLKEFAPLLGHEVPGSRSNHRHHKR